ncbi:glycosyltransferase family 4 protein [Nocardioides conyzicola]|uniref:Glycosyltransferase family 4 protein n=1 Tax=Nocardioides conyzicola TaxID=1651781 RepID=A0ABP8XIE5_9ACTN
MSRLLAITGRAPYSTTEEAFVQDELETMVRHDVDVVVVPTRLATDAPNAGAVRSGLVDRVVAQPLIGPRVLLGALATLVRHPVLTVVAVTEALVGSGSLRNLAANVVSVPKALWAARLARRVGATHVHAYWYAHQATIAMIVGRIAGIPWSATGFRWDIDADNALDAKIERAAFLRVADELGERLVRERVAASRRPGCPVYLIRTGVEMAPPVSTAAPARPPVLCCPGGFVEKKGHRFLIEALQPWAADGREFELHLFGDGPLRADLEGRLETSGLARHTTLHGIVELSVLRGFLRERRPVVVLPSIRADDGQEEGIPVVLIEAMAASCPVVSTRTGSIPDLVLDGCGWLVRDRDPEALRVALEDAVTHPDRTADVVARARERVAGEFDRDVSAMRLVELCETAT